MIERRAMEVAETAFVFFAAMRAQDAAERPRREAGRTQQLPSAAVGVSGALQDRQLRRSAAERAGVFALRQIAIDRANVNRGEDLCVGLQGDFREERLT